MKIKTASLDAQVLEYGEAEQEDFKHPLLTKVRFVFADDKPNGNNQGIEYEDFPLIMKSAINMPIKMRYIGEAGAGGHPAAVTIGHIVDMNEDQLDDGTHRMIADGVIYAGEFPNEDDYLRKAFAEEKAPGASWEVNYDAIKKMGVVNWLKGVVTRAATFVRNPAYGNRTALLALASDSSISDEDFNKKIVDMATEISSPKNTLEGGSNKVEKELEELKAKLEAAEKKVAELEAANASLTTANAELETKNKENEGIIAESKRKDLITDRTNKVAEAGLKVETDAEKLAKKQEFWAGLTDEAFAEYLDDLKAATKVEKPKVGLASLAPSLPRPNGGADEEVTSISDLRTKFRTLNRGSVEAE